jgi:magnesium-transporting ATPase (P-type)
MLTGDKRETAINIAQSSAIVKPGMKVMLISVFFHLETISCLYSMETPMRLFLRNFAKQPIWYLY